MQASRAIAFHMWYRTIDVIERPRKRRAIRDEIVDFTRAQFLGRPALQRSAG